jgi:hypothetical protein
VVINATTLGLCVALASDVAVAGHLLRYPIGQVTKVEVTEPSGRTPLEDKRYFDCDAFSYTEKDLRFALRYGKQVSEKYFNQQTTSIGCYGGGFVIFKNGDRVNVLLERERFSFTPENGKHKGKTFYFTCIACVRSKSFARNPAYKSY